MKRLVIGFGCVLLLQALTPALAIKNGSNPKNKETGDIFAGVGINKEILRRSKSQELKFDTEKLQKAGIGLKRTIRENFLRSIQLRYPLNPQETVSAKEIIAERLGKIEEINDTPTMLTGFSNLQKHVILATTESRDWGTSVADFEKLYQETINTLVEKTKSGLGRELTELESLRMDVAAEVAFLTELVPQATKGGVSVMQGAKTGDFTRKVDYVSAVMRAALVSTARK